MEFHFLFPQNVFRESLQLRARKSEDFQPVGESAKRFEYLPWTSTPGPQGVRTQLIRQFNVTLEKAIPIAEDATLKTIFYQQLVDLCDLVLDGYKSQLDSISSGDRRQAVVYKQYEKDRHALIMPLGMLLIFVPTGLPPLSVNY